MAERLPTPQAKRAREEQDDRWAAISGGLFPKSLCRPLFGSAPRRFTPRLSTNPQGKTKSTSFWSHFPLEAPRIRVAGKVNP